MIGYVPVGATFSVVNGPYCAQGSQWFLVSYNGITGWTGEGNGYGTYWLDRSARLRPVSCPTGSSSAAMGA